MITNVNLIFQEGPRSRSVGRPSTGYGFTGSSISVGANYNGGNYLKNTN